MIVRFLGCDRMVADNGGYFAAIHDSDVMNHD
jgi:hypothetical protein